MEQSQNRLQILIDKLIDNTITGDELAELNEHLKSLDATALANLELEKVWQNANTSLNLNDQVFQNIVTSKRFSQSASNAKSVSLWANRKVWYAAATLVVLGFGAIFYLNQNVGSLKENKHYSTKTLTANLNNSNKIMLTLSDGTQVALDETNMGKLKAEKHAEVVNGNGELVYNSNQTSSTNHEILYNTISTPVGMTYSLVLSDGTKVWLNAMSTLKFPVVFAANQRNVELIGEGYFEVKSDKTKPFLVRANQMKVNVVGTHFNVSAYTNDKNTTTSLLEGIVDVETQNKTSRLEPGQQALLNHQNSSLKVKAFDNSDVLAWKNGYFVFRDESIEDIMKKVARWYNIEVHFKGDLSNKKFGGKFLKSSSLSELLTSLELTEAVHFNIEGRRVTVM